ncbi:MAG: flavin reductase family protein [Firmicutes bacterium]|nr:flavin reductase family protein [Bacillota bacterium]
MAKQSFKPSAMLGPLPAVMVSCGNVADGTDNIITIAWTGIVNSDPPRTYVSLMPRRHSHAIIKESGEFVINLVPESLAAAMDWCGCVSGSKETKFGKHSLKSGPDGSLEFTLTPEPAEKVSCPAIKESPVQLECKVFEVKSLGSHDMFLADIVNVRVDESAITGEGRIAMERLGLVSLIHGSYYAAPKERIGRMGFSVMKPSTKKKISAQQRAKQMIRKQGREKFDRG